MPHAFYTWQPAANSMHLQQPAFKSFSTTPVSAKRIDTRVTPATCAVLVPNRTPCIDTQRGLSLSTQAACPQHAASQPRIRFQHFHDQCYSIFSTNSAQKHVRRPRVLFASPNEAHGGPDQVCSYYLQCAYHMVRPCFLNYHFLSITGCLGDFWCHGSCSHSQSDLLCFGSPFCCKFAICYTSLTCVTKLRVTHVG